VQERETETERERDIIAIEGKYSDRRKKIM